MSIETDPEKMNETVRQAYSHGLEEIYAIQDVDVSTIRTIDVPSEDKPDSSKTEKVLPASVPAQISLPLDGEHQCSMASFILQEPIEVLELAPNLEAYLHGKEIRTIGALLEEDLSARGDIERGLKNYIGDKALYECDRIDYRSFLRAIIGKSPQVKCHVALEEHSLESFYSLSAPQKIEWRRLDEKVKREIHDKTWSEWRESTPYRRFSDGAKEITNVFVKPWMRKRQGIALAYEIRERLCRVAENPVQAKAVINCIEENFCNFQFILDRQLCHADVGLYADSLETAHCYEQLMELAMTYFYRDDLTYDFQQLIGYIMKEVVRGWDPIDERFVKKALSLSPQFRVRRGKNKKLQIWLA